MSQRFSLRFNDSQSFPATPCDMDATWRRALLEPRRFGLKLAVCCSPVADQRVAIRKSTKPVASVIGTS
jgi:hypothetical protein